MASRSTDLTRTNLTRTITVRELSADECDERGLDETLRDTGGSPYVLVTITWPNGEDLQVVGVLTEARVSPEHIQEV